MADVLIVHQFEILMINVFGMHISFIILQVLTIMEVPLPRQIGPFLKCQCLCYLNFHVFRGTMQANPTQTQEGRGK